MRAPAYAKNLIARRQRGERIGLLVVGVHDWSAGEELVAQAGVARVVVPADTLPHALDWSCAVALDCLVLGECAEPVFWATVTMLYAAGAASIWGEFDSGIWRLERYVSKATPQGFYCTGEPVQAGALGQALKINREVSLMTRHGVYGTAPYAAARWPPADRPAQGRRAYRPADRVCA